MRLSAKGQYSLAALVKLAGNETKEPMSAASISKELGISKIFLEQVAASLKKSGLITAVKGTKGGYCLAQDPAGITALDILKSTENTLFESSSHDPLAQVPLISGALSQLIIEPLDRAVEDCLSGITLKALLENTRIHSDSDSFMLYI